MKNIYYSARNIVILALLGGTACAMAQTVNPNGFPSGPHYNLNIIGKKLDYNCDPTLAVDESGNTLYGGVVKVPETGENIQILMKSGRKGSKLVTATELRVLDSCAGFDGDPAMVELPPNEKGYRVYARALAKPGGTSTLTYGGNAFQALDEDGNDLVDLGLVTLKDVTPTGETPGEIIVRSKGKSTAIDITGLFMWSGTVCNIDFSSTPSTTSVEGSVQVCWIDSAEPAGFSPGDTFTAPVAGSCTTGQLLWVKTTCTTYADEWIFNIADLVVSDWLLDNTGSKLIQLRFYPVQ